MISSGKLTAYAAILATLVSFGFPRNPRFLVIPVILVILGSSRYPRYPRPPTYLRYPRYPRSPGYPLYFPERRLALEHHRFNYFRVCAVVDKVSRDHASEFKSLCCR